VLGEVLVPDACRAHLAPTVLPIPLHQQPAVTLQPRGTRCGAVTAWPLGAWRSRCHNDFPRLSLSLCTMACGDKELNRLRVTATRSRPDASAIHGRCGARVALLQSPVPRTVLPTSVQARREETRFRLDRSTQRRPLEVKKVTPKIGYRRVWRRAGVGQSWSGDGSSLAIAISWCVVPRAESWELSAPGVWHSGGGEGV